MAKVRGPLMSMSASGRLARNLIYKSTAAGAVVKSYGRPRKGPSQAQRDKRQAFRDLGAAWHELYAQDVEAWETATAGTRLTAYNRFLQSYLDHYQPGQAVTVCRGAAIEGEDGLAVTVGIEVTAAAQVVISYGSGATILPRSAAATAPAAGRVSLQLTRGRAGEEIYFTVKSSADSPSWLASGTYRVSTLPVTTEEYTGNAFAWSGTTAVGWPDGTPLGY